MKNSRDKDARVRGDGGFTLIELMIVIGVLVLLMAMVLVALSAADVTRMGAEATVNRLAIGIRNYAAAHGGVLPPADFSVIDTRVTVNPTPSTDEEKSSATLFYFLTHQFKSTDVADPTWVGLPPRTKGPFLAINNLETGIRRDASVKEDPVIDLQNGYAGATTWFIDPWGNPYRYGRRAMDTEGNSGDEVTMKRQGKTIAKITGFVLESAGPDGKFGDAGNPSGTDHRDNIRLEQAP